MVDLANQIVEHVQSVGSRNVVVFVLVLNVVGSDNGSILGDIGGT